MPQIAIEKSTYERLQRHAVPFADTPESVILRALDALEAGDVIPGMDAHMPATERCINVSDLPDLTHTKVLYACIGESEVTRPNWNRILEDLICRAVEQGQTFQILRQRCPANLFDGRKTTEGYRYLAPAGVSVQGQDANGACRSAVALAKALALPLNVAFMWRQKVAAAYPGEGGRLITD